MAGSSSPQDGVLEHARVMYYDAGWRLVEERVDPDTSAGGDERVAQTVWGTRYIDDAALRRWRLASKSWPGAAGTGTASDGGTWWYCTDAQFSPVALVAASGAAAERVRYDAYGHARHHHGTDVDGDGDADGADFDLITALIGGGDVPITNTLKYRSELDVNRDGVIDADDGQIVKKAALAALPEGEVSAAAGPDSPVGYCGYLFNAETGLYTVRFRWYSPGLGRFISRDPLGYVDGMGLYEYTGGNPVTRRDPMGLEWTGAPSSPLPPGTAGTTSVGGGSGSNGCERYCNAKKAIQRNCGDFTDVNEVIATISARVFVAAGAVAAYERHAGSLQRSLHSISASTRRDVRGLGSVYVSVREGDLRHKGNAKLRNAKAAGKAVGAAGVLIDGYLLYDAVEEGDVYGAISSGSSVALAAVTMTAAAKGSAVAGPIGGVVVGVAGGAGLYAIDQRVLAPARSADEASRRISCQLAIQGFSRLQEQNPHLAPENCP